MGEESRARQRADSSGCKKPAMQQDKSVVSASFLLVVGILGVLMFAMADESQAHVGFQLVPEEETDLETVSDALTQVREDASYDFDDNEEESDFVQASSEWMWDRSVQARKKLGLAPRGAFKINPVHRSKREMEMARTLVHEASSRARSKIGLVDNSLISFRTVGIRKSHPFSSLMKTADANAQFIKVRNAEALKGIQRIVAKLAKEMIKRAEQVQPPQLSFSQWMWEKKKSKAATRAHEPPGTEGCRRGGARAKGRLPWRGLHGACQGRDEAFHGEHSVVHEARQGARSCAAEGSHPQDVRSDDQPCGSGATPQQDGQNRQGRGAEDQSQGGTARGQDCPREKGPQESQKWSVEEGASE